MPAAAHVRLRPFHSDDIAPFHAAVVESVNELKPWMPWCHDGYTIEEASAWVHLQIQLFEQRSEFEFLVFDAASELVGVCGLNQIDVRNRRANIGYWMRSSQCGKNYATEAVKAVVDWSATNTDFQRLEIVVATGNTASLRVAEKAGAFREGVLRSRLLLHEQFHDAVMFSFVRGE
jgi:ribosomal-protein-serine acetyltransferase